ncbi:hypothetical protein P171DRAFT_172208 [Karstenula rhodostoma CBS 690.94]|uniref:Uncharacterized protein n=1 Tax=Karstenula rhodostoma CBS 690.94 TaxID=1392251 RepID=A0A9P4U5I7_9PLEO|nr:hypothetical protein P171DRAFT_172208 [Karstenula rhodostoma CBS 690.94]
MGFAMTGTPATVSAASAGRWEEKRGAGGQERAALVVVSSTTSLRQFARSTLPAGGQALATPPSTPMRRLTPLPGRSESRIPTSCETRFRQPWTHRVWLSLLSCRRAAAKPLSQARIRCCAGGTCSANPTRPRPASPAHSLPSPLSPASSTPCSAKLTPTFFVRPRDARYRPTCEARSVAPSALLYAPSNQLSGPM